MISIIIPFYNEEKNLPILVDSLAKVMEKIKEDWEVILVNDGSTDNFISKIKNQKSKIDIKNQKETIKLINHKKRLGKGEALKTGIENSSGEIIVFMDGDLQDDPADLPKFLEKIKQGYDFVNGARKRR
ncbi:MAG: glycosyltransferase family 2 protein, partial [Candidatus Omnitrophota bacterium]